MQNLTASPAAWRPHLSRSAGFFLLLPALALGLAAPLTQAADYASFRVGAIELTPDYNTKVTPTGSVLLPNGEVESAELLLFKPRVTAFVAGEGKQFSSTVEVQNGIYSAVGNAGYVDWKVENIARFEFAGNRSIRFRTESFNTHDGADSAVLPDADHEPARFLASTFDTSYEQALWDNRGQLVLDAGTFAKDYFDAESGDHANRHVGSSFRYRLLPGTHLQLQYRALDIAPLKQPPNASPGAGGARQETFSYIGATWEPTVDIAGHLRVASGYKQTVNRTVAANAIADISTWETNIRWQPVDSSTLSFAADRSFRHHPGLTSTGSTSSYRYNWEHRWAHQLKTTLAGSYSVNVDAATRREDEGLGVKFRLDYVYSAWLDMFVAFGHDRHQSGGVLSFSQQTLRLGIAASLDRFFGR